MSLMSHHNVLFQRCYRVIVRHVKPISCRLGGPAWTASAKWSPRSCQFRACVRIEAKIERLPTFAVQISLMVRLVPHVECALNSARVPKQGTTHATSLIVETTRQGAPVAVAGAGGVLSPCQHCVRVACSLWTGKPLNRFRYPLHPFLSRKVFSSHIQTFSFFILHPAVH